jgi:phage terminase large subunit-like protein
MVKAAWFRHCTQDELPAKFERIVQSWDTASKATELSRHPSLRRMRGREGRGCTSWGIQGKELYQLDVLRRRMEYPELKRAVRDQSDT